MPYENESIRKGSAPRSHFQGARGSMERAHLSAGQSVRSITIETGVQHSAFAEKLNRSSLNPDLAPLSSPVSQPLYHYSPENESYLNQASQYHPQQHRHYLPENESYSNQATQYHPQQHRHYLPENESYSNQATQYHHTGSQPPYHAPSGNEHHLIQPPQYPFTASQQAFGYQVPPGNYSHLPQAYGRFGPTVGKLQAQAASVTVYSELPKKSISANLFDEVRHQKEKNHAKAMGKNLKKAEEKTTIQFHKEVDSIKRKNEKLADFYGEVAIKLEQVSQKGKQLQEANKPTRQPSTEELKEDRRSLQETMANIAEVLGNPRRTVAFQTGAVLEMLSRWLQEKAKAAEKEKRYIVEHAEGRLSAAQESRQAEQRKLAEEYESALKIISEIEFEKLPKPERIQLLGHINRLKQNFRRRQEGLRLRTKGYGQLMDEATRRRKDIDKEYEAAKRTLRREAKEASRRS